MRYPRGSGHFSIASILSSHLRSASKSTVYSQYVRHGTPSFFCVALFAVPPSPLSQHQQAEKKWKFNMRLSLGRRPDDGLLSGLSVYVDPAVVSIKREPRM